MGSGEGGQEVVDHRASGCAQLEVGHGEEGEVGSREWRGRVDHIATTQEVFQSELQDVHSLRWERGKMGEEEDGRERRVGGEKGEGSLFPLHLNNLATPYPGNEPKMVIPLFSHPPSSPQALGFTAGRTGESHREDDGGRLCQVCYGRHPTAAAVCTGDGNTSQQPRENRL